ncbi:MAG TPA: RDD family protein [Hyphomicrobiales bacterium]|nr:RDD family protein [Hyphomicrobiales bacterium]
MTAIDALPILARFDDVRRKRIFAWIVDIVIVALLTLGASLVIGVLGLFTFGLAWMLYGWVGLIVAVLYSGITIGGRRQATVGMALMGLVFRVDAGGPATFLYGAAHMLLFYVSMSLLTPLILLVSLFSPRKRLLHDMVLGVVIENLV